MPLQLLILIYGAADDVTAFEYLLNSFVCAPSNGDDLNIFRLVFSVVSQRCEVEIVCCTGFGKRYKTGSETVGFNLCCSPVCVGVELVFFASDLLPYGKMINM